MTPEFRVVAIVAAFNEADIVAQVVADLIGQGVHVYFLDDGSTDRTVAAVEPYLGRGLLAIEALRPPRPVDDHEPFDWARILRRKAAIAREVDADWFIHHDADELRESPWPDVPLGEAFRRVDAAGFNAVDFASFDFWPVHDRFQPDDDVRAAFPYYAERAAYDRVQVRAWKRTDAAVDLESSGGHDAQFDGRRVFPIRFISRHYPIRSQAHGERKVFRERLGRFLADERARGWHVQYDGVQPGTTFIRDPATLIAYDGDTARMSLALRHRDVEALEAADAELRCAIDAQRRELEARAGEIDIRGREIDRLTREIAHRTRDVEAHRHAIEQQARELEHRNRDLEAHRHAIEQQACELEHRDRDLEAHRNAIAQLTLHLDAHQQELERRREEIGRHREELERCRTEITRQRAEIDNRGREIDAARDCVARQGEAVDSLQAALRESGRQVDELRRSLSWRLTSPARALLRTLRGR